MRHGLLRFEYKLRTRVCAVKKLNLISLSSLHTKGAMDMCDH